MQRVQTFFNDVKNVVWNSNVVKTLNIHFENTQLNMFENLSNKNVNAKTLIKTSIQVCVVRNINNNKIH